ncbi:MAG: UDP-N-acetylmuramate dehydrogenase [Fimbriimonadales bacterium]
MNVVADKIAELRRKFPALIVRENATLVSYTTLMAGGPARWLVEVRDADTLAGVAALSQTLAIPHITLGSGTNILPADQGFPGLAIVNLCRRMYFGKTQYAECGCWFQDVFLQAAQRGLSGLEFAVGIPGTLGGALVSNAGAYRSNIADLLTEVELVRDGDRRWVLPEYLEFRYRHSILRRNDPPAITLLAVKMKLEPGEPKHIYDQARDYQRQRISKQPPHPSAGSFFKNVQSHDLAQQLPNLPEKMKDAGVVPAGFLIEACGLKGARRGGAAISGRHGNFLCNVGGAKATDIRGLAEMIREAVLKRFDVQLEEEVLYIGDWMPR